MQISKITAKYTPLNCGYYISFSSRSSKNIKCNEDTSFITTGLIGLGIIAGAGIMASELKKNRISPAKIIKKLFPPKNQSKEQIMLNRLHGKRDAEAKALYEAYIARDKHESLVKRYLKREFSSDVMPYISANNTCLKRMASSVL